MSSSYSQSKADPGHEKLLWLALALTATFLIAEVIGALATKSLALLSDAAHMFTDTAALAVSLAAMRVAKRVADRRRTFGYQRFEILAAAFNATVLFMVAMYILIEAYQRLRSPQPIASSAMLIIASVGLVVNLISMRLLKAASKESLNVKGAYLEVWSDMLGSIGVIIAALLIKWTGKLWIDSLIAAGIGLWVLPRTWTLLKESINVLLQAVPAGIDIEDLERTLLGAEGVLEVHDLHVWSLTSGKHVLSVHIVADLSVFEEQAILAQVDALVRRLGISDTTIQIEAKHFHPDGAANQPDFHIHAH